MSFRYSVLEVRYIPEWLPGAGFKRHALKARNLINDMIDMPFEFVKRNRVCVHFPPVDIFVTHDKVRFMQLLGTALPSFVSSLLDEQKPGTLDAEVEEDMKAVSGNIYSAGVETVRALLDGERHSH